MKRLRIGLDLDNVLLDFYSHICDYYNARHGTSWKYSDLKSWYLEHTWGCSNQYVVDILDDFYHSDEHKLVTPIVGSTKAIEELSPSHDLFIITSKPDYLKKQTEEWLLNQYGDVFKSVHMINQYHGEGPRRTKSGVCEELCVDIFVDDHIGNTVEVADTGVKALLFDAPWNRVEIPQHVERAHSWEDVVLKINLFAESA